MGLFFLIDDRSLITTAEYSSLGTTAFVPILIYSIFQSGLSEKLLFRGFILKVGEQKIGFKYDNLIQAFIFGMLHGIILFEHLNVYVVWLIIFFSAIAGWLMGFINEKLSGGSIVPSWIIHALVNVISMSLIAFDIL